MPEYRYQEFDKSIAGEQWKQKSLWSRLERMIGEEENLFEKLCWKGWQRMGHEGVLGQKVGSFQKRAAPACLYVGGTEPVERNKLICRRKRGE